MVLAFYFGVQKNLHLEIKNHFCFGVQKSLHLEIQIHFYFGVQKKSALRNLFFLFRRAEKSAPRIKN